ncbi:hypothetical protein [Curtobacterium sp. VKM Ac-2884]|uniref:hypothetical protein n=1 Tax=Curtobacterium sp. VKM Ac-2884 TaxID=2783818 RepID=UPI00188DC3CA|nr:hypothetical protein [Curtobacterium sp. VKM Ac-2884]MBF4603139.1 hypothetical protein [Curtobacterium sp. VKM Ac-2884]
MTTYRPRELAAELGYTNESRPGRVVREYLRERYPEHTGLWELDEAQADDVRANVQRSS